ncbi:MAG: GntR family transcriptional regulator [Planctomycetota bacterium]|nr:GntR family transcriptional regulator [Planctomycetota bacterium]
MPLTLKQHAYAVIREKLISGAHSGQRLSDDAFAKELGISRSPVREAISQLASEGLIDYRPRSGAYVRVPALDELAELYDVRLALEPFAVAKATERMQPHELAALQQLLIDMHAIVEECRSRPGHIAEKALTERFLVIDHEFHMLILAAAGNKRMMRMVDDCKVMVRVFGHVPVIHDLKLIEKIASQHEEILRDIERGEGAMAANHMREHIEFARNVIIQCNLLSKATADQ